MKKFFSLILSVVMLVTIFAGCSAKKEDNKFIVGFDSEFPPMGFIADDGKYVGFDLDLAEEVAKRLGLEFIAQPIAWDSKDN